MSLPQTVGVIGVGHLIKHMMPAMARTGVRFLLSARNEAIATDLSERFGGEVVQSNQDIIDRSDVVILAVRPFHAVDVAGGLRFRAGQTVLSVCAGVGSAALAPAVAPAGLALAMPVIAAEFGESPTLLWPDDAACRALLEPCGPVVALGEEAQFAPGSVIACYFGWMEELLRRMTDWTAGQGIDPEAARLLVTQMTRAAATVVRDCTDKSPAKLVSEVATPRSFTLWGIDRLNAAGALEAWTDAAAHLSVKLNEGNQH